MMAKAGMAMPDDSPENAEANCAAAHPSSTDTAANLRRANGLHAELRASGQISADDAAAFEAKLIRAHDDESVVRQSDPSRMERMAATRRAGGILRDLARSGGLDATQVATYEAQIHGLESTLSMGAAGDGRNPLG